jgi:hypothetical protein
MINLVKSESNRCSAGQIVCKDLYRNILQDNRRLSRLYYSKRLKVIFIPPASAFNLQPSAFPPNLFLSTSPFNL